MPALTVHWHQRKVSIPCPNWQNFLGWENGSLCLQPFPVLKVVVPHLIAHHNVPQKCITLCLAAWQNAPTIVPNIDACDQKAKTCHFHVFGPLQQVLRSCRLRSDKDTGATVMQWLQQQLRQFSPEIIHQLIHQLVACLSPHEDYFLQPLFLHPEQSSNGFIWTSYIFTPPPQLKGPWNDVKQQIYFFHFFSRMSYNTVTMLNQFWIQFDNGN